MRYSDKRNVTEKERNRIVEKFLTIIGATLRSFFLYYIFARLRDYTRRLNEEEELSHSSQRKSLEGLLFISFSFSPSLFRSLSFSPVQPLLPSIILSARRFQFALFLHHYRAPAARAKLYLIVIDC